MTYAALDSFFKKMDDNGIKLTYDDVRLHTTYSEINPTETDLTTRFSRRLRIKIPIASSPMDTVTTSDMAIAMAESGGIGIIHRGLSPETQVREVARVKNRLNGRIQKPIALQSEWTIAQVIAMREAKQYAFHTFPVVDETGRLVGLMTRNDFDFSDPSSRVSQMMTPLADLTKARVGISHQAARDLMKKYKKKTLPIVTEDDMLAGMYIYSDVERVLSKKHAHNLDSTGQLVVGAAVGVGDGALARAELCANAMCDVFQIDTAHGDSGNVVSTIRELKVRYPHIDVVAGNVSNGRSARRLADAGADGVLVGQGPGSICTTRVIAGIGVPQVSAVYDCALALRGTGVPVCADGGISNSGDMVIALAVGAESVMVGRLLAGAEEAPGETRFFEGRLIKDYRGMGSLGAMRDNVASRDKYGQGALTISKVVPEGIEGIVAFKGPVKDVLVQYVGGIRAGLGYNGAKTIKELRAIAEPFRMSSAGLTESHPHDVMITAQAPNYHSR
jgi:IMP dehydrogenase